ncbi:MAG TPA: hypothetical protein VFC93_14170 [Chloroflexota bacterium]|nr:hypothetical protein [Chloroflexota bacterium]
MGEHVLVVGVERPAEGPVRVGDRRSAQVSEIDLREQRCCQRVVQRRLGGLALREEVDPRRRRRLAREPAIGDRARIEHVPDLVLPLKRRNGLHVAQAANHEGEA